MIRWFKLMQDDICLGTLMPYEYDFPWVYCDFNPSHSFQTVKNFFIKELELMNKCINGEDLNCQTNWEQVYSNICELGLSLVGDEGTIITEFLLHIDVIENKAWFRS